MENFSFCAVVNSDSQRVLIFSSEAVTRSSLQFYLKCYSKCYSSVFLRNLSEQLFISSSPEVPLGKSVLKICSKFTREHPCQSVISIKLFCNFIEFTWVFNCKFAAPLKSHFGMVALL